MESELLVSWHEERAELRKEVSHLQDELAESRAEREELESRAQALTDRLSQTLDPSLSFSLRLGDEQREWGKKLREGREREARQALLIHKLQNKVVEYRARCQALEQQVISEERELRARERLLLDERSDTLESNLIRLEEEQQRCMGLSEVNVVLRSQLCQSTEANDALRDDLRKLTADWSKAVEEVMQKEIEWQKEKESLTGHIGKEQTRLMTLWGRVVTLKRQCHSLKTATDKDLWELRADVSRVSSSLLSVWTSAQSALTLPLDSTAAHPLSSTQGPLSLDDLEHDQSKELEVDLQSETLELRNRIAELNMTVKALESEREKQEAEMERKHRQEMERQREQERKWEKQIELERNFESVRHAWRVVNSQEKSGQSNLLSADDVSTEGLSSVLSIIAQAETALQWKQQEVQDAQINMRRLGAEKETLEQKMAQLEREREELQEQTNQGALKITHTKELLNR
ncbi:Centrosome-associated protein CEP250 250 kDa centrosomal protein [Triplophysa tibetana]|uniref:Centrosome-associated protein CEP250 250 kDa centrosomal protein n=1 Tax=Triplophysa tibetana TaxID=1572043 RepID=A0A5A9P1R3_9TELE|nr:Centrosome-associated protein CEP250 250 kDa centrosomal protein [Triplophysa tibetana]